MNTLMFSFLITSLSEFLEYLKLLPFYFLLSLPRGIFPKWVLHSYISLNLICEKSNLICQLFFFQKRFNLLMLNPELDLRLKDRWKDLKGRWPLWCPGHFGLLFCCYFYCWLGINFILWGFLKYIPWVHQ